MLDIYNQFRDFHVFKRFKSLLGDWWNIDVLVVVRIGNRFLSDKVARIQNPTVKNLLESSLFKNHFLSSLKAVCYKTNVDSSPKHVLWKQTGLELFVVPLALKESPFSAFLVATGFAPKKEEELRQALLYLGLSKKLVEQRMNHLKKISKTDEVYMQKMLRILAEDFFTLLQEKKKQNSLIENMQKKNLSSVDQFLGRAPSMQYIFNILKKIKNYDTSLLIEGENGTGKRLLARTIHAQSSRAGKAFFIQNFSAFKGRLLEHEFFGYSAKAFPNVRRGKPAILEKMDGGTVFLNEISNTSLEFQEKLLKFLKEGVFFSTGDIKLKKANVRVIASTSQDLKALTAKGQFNEKLYFTISSMVIKTPPLKNRTEDILLLIQHFLKRQGYMKKLKFSASAVKALYSYSWPGNIRELENETARLLSVIGEDQNVVHTKDLSSSIQRSSSQLDEIFQTGKQNLKKAVSTLEKKILLDCLEQHNWNKSYVARSLGLSRTSLLFKIREYGLLKKEGA